jgi:amino acid adenylation domain-containing protein
MRSNSTEYVAGGDERSLPELLLGQVRRSPDAIAVRAGDVGLTYAELDRLTERLAGRLVASGIEREARVGIVMDRSVEAVIAELAVVRSGAAYLPVDVRAPAQRKLDVLAQADCAVVLSDAASAEKVQELGSRYPVLIMDVADLASAPHPSVDLPPVYPDNLAYVMYTSGSTGEPKGVAVRHRDVAALAFDSRVGHEVERILLHSPLAFDASTYELWVPVLNGGCVVLAPPGELDVDALAGTIVAQRITGLWLTAGLFGLVAQLIPECLGGLRELWVGGDVVSASAVRQVQRDHPDLVVVNGYGPTETTTFATAYPATGIDAATDPFPIGSALDGTRTYLLDSAGRRVTDGAIGELYIAGAGVARGYLGRPGLTAQRFVPDPFGPSGTRMYRTGDLATQGADGLLRLCGRADDQVKVRGFRIEPAEIAGALTAMAAIAQAVVVAHGDTHAARKLVAYLVPTRGSAMPNDAELRAWLSRSLPDYMLPSAFVTLDAMPLTANGKIDRSALPVTRFDIEAGEPRTESERFVTRVWADVLGLADVGINEDFFRLGGNSLTAAQIIARVAELAPGLSPRTLMRDLLRNPTAAQFAKILGEYTTEESGVTIPIISRTRSVPLSLGQKRLWFLDQFVSHEAEYAVAFALRIGGALDRAALGLALREIIDRHEILRTSVLDQDGELTGLVRSADEFGLAILDVDGSASGVDGLDKLIAEETNRPFDLTNGLPVRASLLVCGETDAVLCLTFHHMVFDGWSISLLYDEMEVLYNAFASGSASPLEPLTVQYADVTAFQESRQAGAEFAEKLNFWRAELAGVHPTELGTDLPRPVRRTAPGALRCFDVSEPVIAALERIGAEHGATLFMVLLAAWQILLFRYTGSEDVVVGTTAAERDLVESEPLIGLFVNMLVLRGDLSGNPTFVELLERSRDRAVEAYGRQDVPFDRLVEELAPERDLSRTPIFQIIIKLNNARQRRPKLRGLVVQELPTPEIPAKYDLELSLSRTDDGLAGELTYDTGLYRSASIDRLVGHFVALLDSLAETPHGRIDGLALTSPATRQHDDHQPDRPAVDFPARGLHELFEEQVKAVPDAVAVVDDCGEITYSELDQWADQIALSLREHGAGPDVVIGVLLDRSAQMVAALLGVLKSGSAYLPIETDTPPARIRQLLTTAAAPACVLRSDLVPVVEQAGCRPITVPDRDCGDVVPARAASTVDPDSLVAVYYTSGSTGTPKGVACTHAGWVNRMSWMGRHHPLRQGETVLHKTTLTFDDAAVEIFWPLLNGARVALLGPGLHRDPRAILDAAIRYDAVHVQFVPSVLELFLHTVTECDVERLGPLRSVLSSGEALRPEVVRRFRAVFGDRIVLDNTWGATEVSIDSTCHVCDDRDAEADRGTVSVGLPIDNNEVLVLDSRMTRTPVGLAGELYIGGIGLARGYLGDPRRTAEAFLPHPERAGERIYRTGDWGKLTESGSVTFLTRRDDQVKIRGVRVELGEVEHALRTYAPVADAAVLAWEHAPGDKRLAAYVMPRTGEAGITTKELLTHLRSALPVYLLPSSIAVLPRLPRHANGKLDKRGLPLPDPLSTMDELAEQYVAPRSAVEEIVTEIWSGVLGLPRMGVHDDFFTTGGHSLLATRAIGRMRHVFATDLPLTLIFEHSTPANAAAALEAMLVVEMPKLDDA